MLRVCVASSKQLTKRKDHHTRYVSIGDGKQIWCKWCCDHVDRNIAVAPAANALTATTRAATTIASTRQNTHHRVACMRAL